VSKLLVSALEPNDVQVRTVSLTLDFALEVTTINAVHLQLRKPPNFLRFAMFLVAKGTSSNPEFVQAPSLANLLEVIQPKDIAQVHLLIFNVADQSRLNFDEKKNIYIFKSKFNHIYFFPHDL
jgi:hypothetical protein